MFQAMMNELLRDLINTGKIESFINNIMVEIESEEEYNKLVEEILRRLEENNLYVKPEKYKWKFREVDFLGVVIGPERIKIEKKKVKEVLDQPVQKLVKDVQKFLGLENYYRRFIEEFSKIARLLHKLTKKEQKWEWGIRQKKAFEALKKRFIIELILIVLDLDRNLRMEVNVLNYATGKVLSMKCSVGK